MKRIALIPCALILVLILIFYLTEGFHVLNFEVIQQKHLEWKSFVLKNPIESALIFMGVYILSVMLVIPDSTFLTLIGGFLFPLPLAVAYACFSETAGAAIFFWAVKLASAETLGKQRKPFFRKPFLYKFQEGFQANQASYLLFFRFSHLLPFWIINLGAGLFRAKTSTFIWTTLIGVLPLTFFLANGAQSFSKYFETHTHFRFNEIFTLQLKISLVALGCIALLPVLYNKFFRKK